MPKNTSKTGKSSKTARVLSLLTDPAASLLGGSRTHKDDDETELTEGAPQSAAPGLDDAATESRIHDSLASQEDELMGMFGKPQPSRPAPRNEEPPRFVTKDSAPPPQEEAQTPEPDPRTMELLSMLSNPSTLGNSAMPIHDSPRPAALDMDFAEELTAGLESPPPREEEPEPTQPAPSQPMREAAPQAQAVQQPYAQPQAQAVQQPYAQPQTQAVQQAAPQPQAQAAQQSYAQPQAQAVQQPYAQPQTQAAQQPYAQPQAQAAPRTASSPAAHAVQKKQEEFVCFNLTQALVEDKADKLMKQFGMCTCNRCRVDVTALALSNLPAKYVAMQNRDILPLLSMYEEKYSAAVTVQVMSACRMVMNRPHHGR
ncbi:MAG: late competence development ComFB family protein [Oscillibacter sp.]|nr:late competence development ComFB family protein [Oscillibacter sp.]